MGKQARKLVLLALVIFSIFSIQGLHGSQPAEAKPLVLVVYADWCPMCQKLKPVLALINDKYNGKIRFVQLDVTSGETTAKSKLRARSMGLEQFFNKNYDATSLVVIQDPAGHEIFRTRHDYDFQHYAAVLDEQLRAQARR